MRLANRENGSVTDLFETVMELQINSANQSQAPATSYYGPTHQAECAQSMYILQQQTKLNKNVG